MEAPEPSWSTLTRSHPSIPTLSVDGPCWLGVIQVYPPFCVDPKIWILRSGENWVKGTKGPVSKRDSQTCIRKFESKGRPWRDWHGIIGCPGWAPGSRGTWTVVGGRNIVWVVAGDCVVVLFVIFPRSSYSVFHNGHATCSPALVIFCLWVSFGLQGFWFFVFGLWTS